MSSSSSSLKDTTLARSKWKCNAFGQPCPNKPARWQPDEVAKLRELIRNACAARQITCQSDLFEKKTKATRHTKKATADTSLWYEIAQAFPSRQVEAVYKKAYREHQQSTCQAAGTWTADETKQLLEHVAVHGTKWTTISRLLQRTADSCADKYRECHKDYDKGPWSEAETQKLKQLVAQELRDQQQAATTSTIPWTAISKRMGDRSRLSCLNKWNLIHQNGQASLPESSPSPRRRGTKKRRASKSVPDTNNIDSNENDNDDSTVPPSDPSSLSRLYESLDELYGQSDKQTVSTKDILQALQAKFPRDQTLTQKETRKLLKDRLLDLAVGRIVPTTTRSVPTSNTNTGRPKKKAKRDNPRDTAAVTANNSTKVTKDIQSTRDASKHDKEPATAATTTTTTTTSKDADSYSLTIQSVSTIMKDILRKAPQNQMKKKKLQRAVRNHVASLLSSHSSGSSSSSNNKNTDGKQVKKLMKKLCKDGSKRQQFKLLNENIVTVM